MAAKKKWIAKATENAQGHFAAKAKAAATIGIIAATLLAGVPMRSGNYVRAFIALVAIIFFFRLAFDKAKTL